MSVGSIIVTAGGIAFIVWVNWYFLFAEHRQTRAAQSAGGVQEITVRVHAGYSPDVIVVRAGEPVRLNFYREETASCTEEVVFSDFGIRRQLPAFQTTAVEFTPAHPGTFEFTCGMNMVRGKVIAEAGHGD